MISYTQYKKAKLNRNLPYMSVREGLDNHFDLLQLELNEAIELPSLLLEGNMQFNCFYESKKRKILHTTNNSSVSLSLNLNAIF